MPAPVAAPRAGVASAPVEPTDAPPPPVVARLAAPLASVATYAPRGDADSPSRMVTVWEAPRSVRQAQERVAKPRPDPPPDAVESARDAQGIPNASAPPRAAVYLFVAFALVSGWLATRAVIAGRSHPHSP